MAEEEARKIYTLSVPEQGLEVRHLTAPEAHAWLIGERDFWALFTGLPADISQTRYATSLPSLERAYQKLYSGIPKLASDDDESSLLAFFDKIQVLASQLRIVLSEGEIATEARAHLTRSPHRAYFLLATYSEELVPSIPDVAWFEPLRAIAMAAPAARSHIDRLRIDAAVHAAGRAEGEMHERLQASSDLADDATARLVQLEKLYHERLVLEGPSRHWKAVADAARRGKQIAFAAFCLLLAIPASLIYRNFDDLLAFIERVTAMTSGSFSVTSAVLISVPVLAYAWLLKHVSRSYVQNSTIQTDALHRRVMVTTFLGLAKRKAIDLDEKDRALILNALFRPAPPNTSDEGPPAGLAEFLRK